MLVLTLTKGVHQMGNFKIKVKIEFVECETNTDKDPQEKDDGSFEMIIDEKDAISIDNSEKALLATAYPSIRKALAKHLEEVSKKKTLENAETLEIEEIEDGYKVDGEVGRFYFNTYQTIREAGRVYNTAIDLFPTLKGKEWYRTVGFKDIAFFYGNVESSYRKTTKLINRVRYQQIDGTPYRTLQDNTDKEGVRLVDHMEKKTTNILKRHRFLEDATYAGDPAKFESSKPSCLSEKTIKNAAADLDVEFEVQEILDNPVLLEDPSKSVNITIDDVCVKRQTEKRTKETRSPDNKRKRKSVYNTVIRIDKEGNHYSMVGAGIKATLRYLIAFLLSNRLVEYRFQFFTDGHTILNDTIRRCFSWYSNCGIILDWFHLIKKCKELLSSSMKGRVIRNEILRLIMPLLWYGLTNRAITVLEHIGSENVKNDEKRKKLILYLERNRGMIPCYALRKRLGLQNSSAIGEKMNDLLVSSRQKHNGMSWSKIGSLALAALTAAKLNGEKNIWMKNRALQFKLST